MTVYSFPPIVAAQATILILGSMPGEKSLADAQYYAHPRNAFWPLMSQIFAQPVADYASKIALVQNNRLAVWDVLHACTREGSLDQAIEKDSIVPNDFLTFLTAQSHIAHIFFNGNTAHDMFMRHVWKNLPTDMRDRITLHTLPSTSPAMASLTLAQKTEIWCAAFTRAQGARNLPAGGG